MPWQPFRRKNKHKPLRDDEMETSFDDILSRSMSDGSLVRAPSERFLLSSLSQGRSYGTCSGSTNLWTSFSEHTVQQGDTIAGLSLRFNLTIQDIKLANKLWTNEDLWPGRIIKIPQLETGNTSLDLSSSGGSDTMSTGSGTSSRSSSRRLSSHDTMLVPSASSSPYTKSSTTTSTTLVKGISSPARRASLEELQDFLSKMDSNIASSKRATISMIRKSDLSEEGGATGPAPLQGMSVLPVQGVTVVSNNNTKPSQNHICL